MLAAPLGGVQPLEIVVILALLFAIVGLASVAAIGTALLGLVWANCLEVKLEQCAKFFVNDLLLKHPCEKTRRDMVAITEDIRSSIIRTRTAAGRRAKYGLDTTCSRSKRVSRALATPSPSSSTGLYVAATVRSCGVITRRTGCARGVLP